jgi:hypothetical protein
MSSADEAQVDVLATGAPAPVAPGDEATQVDAELLAILRCPEDGGELTPRGAALACRSCGHTYPVTDGIPDLTIRPRG